MFVGKFIRYKRKELGLTQEQLADGICSITYISKVENNTIKPKQDILSHICKKLDLEPLGLKGDNNQGLINLMKDVYYGIVDRINLHEISCRLGEIQEKIKDKIDPNLQIGYKLILAQYFLYQRDERKAMEKLDEAKQNLSYLSKEFRFWFFNSYGLYQYLFGSPLDSLNSYKKAKEIMNEIDLEQAQANINYQLGLVNAQLMNINDSIFYTKKALDIYNNQLHFQRILDCNILIGINYNRIEKHSLAEKQFLKLLTISAPINDQKYLGKIYHNLGYTYSLKREYDLATQYLKKALEHKKSPKERLSSMYVLAYVFKKNNQLELQLEYIKKGIKLSEEENNYAFYYKFKIMKLLSLENQETKSLFKTLEKEALPYYQKYNPSLYQELNLLLATLYKKNMLYKKSTHYYERYLESTNENSIKEFLY
ncbi:helix-turn-helix domain-containing protein [Halobacillus sp. A5]|uniref:helix-turn-helix domain-containing protein n=1 Tax=Halobacillus sp. A5 TaxID=2880263 RepID=UPI0020A6459E|nr:helix-turn-helix transcriptional regulator [Halobacillus sp. A5]MCP3029623.1 helix-turn-helix transcriptional regulator [Halobacillus sp. A5]